MRLPLETPTLIGRLVQGSGHLGAIDLTCVLFSGPDEPEEKPALGELNPEGREREALGIDSVRECEERGKQEVRVRGGDVMTGAEGGAM